MHHNPGIAKALAQAHHDDLIAARNHTLRVREAREARNARRARQEAPPVPAARPFGVAVTRFVAGRLAVLRLLRRPTGPA